jgi:copper chaperone CopZ
MLAGACCLLQLALNLVSVGCAGFNTHLGPLRPYFVSLLLYLTALTSRLSKHHRPASLASWGAATALRWSLALLPEALHLWNNRESWLPRRLLQPRGTVGSKIQAVVDLEVPTMGCAACINKIDGSLNKLESVVSAKSNLKEAGGSTQVRIAVNTQAELDSALTLLTRTVDEAGFWGSTVESVKVEANGANAKE